MSDRPLQRNAADRKQGKFAARKVRDREDRRRAIVAKQLSTPEGREFVWGELERCGILDRVGVPDSATLYVLTGRRDAGLELYVEVQAFPERYLEMQREAISRHKRLQREIEAVHADKESEQ